MTKYGQFYNRKQYTLRVLSIWQKLSEIRDAGEGKWLGHFSEIPTENWGVRFEVVRSFLLVRTKRNVAYHLPISRLLVGSRLTPLFLDSNRNGCDLGCDNSAVNW